MQQQFGTYSVDVTPFYGKIAIAFKEKTTEVKK